MTFAQLRHTVLRWLTGREYSRQELELKLQRQVSDHSLIQQLLDELQEQGWQSDSRCADMYVRARLHQGYGPLRIQQELATKGIDEELIMVALTTHQANDPHWVQSCWSKKFCEQVPNSPAVWQKQLHFLRYRGFSSEVAQRWLRQLQVEGLSHEMV